MFTRNALVVAVAATLGAVAVGAQQPAKHAKPAPTQAAPAAKTVATNAMPVSVDSAKKIVVANAPGATVSSARLQGKGNKAVYAVSYKLDGSMKTMHATVDAHSGRFMAPVANHAKTSAKKPG